MEPIVITKPAMGLLFMQVCASNEITHRQIIDFANEHNPSGTKLGWVRICEKDGQGPVPCEEHKDRTHYMLEC